MRQDLTFTTREDGIRVLDAMCDILTRFGFVTVADLKGLTAMCSDIHKDQKIGWKSLDDVETFSDGEKFIVRFPEPKGPFDDMTPQEINFITHPFWREIEKKIEENKDFAYTLTKDREPIAVIVSAEFLKREREDIQIVCDRLNEERENIRTGFTKETS